MTNFIYKLLWFCRWNLSFFQCFCLLCFFTLYFTSATMTFFILSKDRIIGRWKMSFYFLQFIKRNFFFSNLTLLLFIYYDIFHPLSIFKTPDEICHSWTHFSCLPSILYPSLNYLVGYYIFSLMSSPIKTKK